MKDSEYARLSRCNSILADKVKKSSNEPKVDCIFCNTEQMQDPFCKCLNELYCKIGNCKFYKV